MTQNEEYHVVEFPLLRATPRYATAPLWAICAEHRCMEPTVFLGGRWYGDHSPPLEDLWLLPNQERYEPPKVRIGEP